MLEYLESVQQAIFHVPPVGRILHQIDLEQPAHRDVRDAPHHALPVGRQGQELQVSCSTCRKERTS